MSPLWLREKCLKFCPQTSKTENIVRSRVSLTFSTEKSSSSQKRTYTRNETMIICALSHIYQMTLTNTACINKPNKVLCSFLLFSFIKHVAQLLKQNTEVFEYT